ncbi:zinc carboxypeptidase-like [Sitodiplosis mosellana]|uniref:zinc carboxypeptidase-like n=1 Tax=Sitodiplosis mosellana TaxID=263140 RepID=UPI00244512DC|nr:zinc carboxypeptidase-like [Sitodiplosis mosellana]
MVEFINATESIKLYLTFHSYDQKLLFPNGYTNESIPEYNNLIQIGGKALGAIKGRFGSEYTCGNSNEDYPSSGETIDWVYGVKKVPLVYKIELRDKGKHGFVLPADQIIPNAIEVLNGLKAMVKEAKALKYL